MPLVHDNGAWNPRAEAAELDRRMVGRPEWQRTYLARQVREEASLERWPKWEHQLSREWTESEKAVVAYYMDCQRMQPVNGGGNDNWDAIGLKIDRLTNAVEARCEARLALEVEMGAAV